MNEQLIEAATGEEKLLNGEPWYPPGCTKLGSAGFVLLDEYMGSEDDIARTARTSYGKGTVSKSDNVTLIRRLLRDRHTSPTEFVEFKFLLMVPMDTWRQWIRHRTANVSEYSTRYSEAIDEKLVTPPDKWRSQSKSNKQGSGDYLVDWPENVRIVRVGKDVPSHDDMLLIQSLNEKTGEVSEFTYPAGCFGPGIPTLGDFLSVTESDFHEQSDELYKLRLAVGMAREQARKDLPLSTYTRAYWKIDLHNFLHFCALRMDSHAQLEIREYAWAMFEQVRPHFPNVCQAFEEYRLNAMSLTQRDQIVVVELASGRVVDAGGLQDLLSNTFDNKQEMRECVAKIKKLGFPDWGLTLG